MKPSVFFRLSLCVTLLLTNVPRGLGEGKNDLPSPPPRLRPIGTIESLGVLTIDGRLAKGQEVLWGKELIQSPDNASARLTLHAIGQASLQPASVVRVTTLMATDGNHTSPPTLLATLLKGSLHLQLQTGAMAYLTAGQTSLIASDGAHVRLALQAETLVANATRGTLANLGQWMLNLPMPVLLAAEKTIRVQQQTQVRKYIIKPYNLGIATEVRARSSRQIQVRVTDENDKPVTDLPVAFSLKDGIGQLSTNGLTNANGVATASFSASAVQGTSLYTVTIPGTTATFTGSITVVSAGLITAATVIPVVAAAGAAAVTGVAVAAQKNEAATSTTTTPLPPPVIRP